MSPARTTLRPAPDDPCESCQQRPGVVTVPGNQSAVDDHGDPYDIRLCWPCASLLPADERWPNGTVYV